MFTWFLWVSSRLIGQRYIGRWKCRWTKAIAFRQGGRASHASSRLIYPHCLGSPLLASCWHEHDTIDRLDPGPPTAPQVHVRPSTSHTRFSAQRAQFFGMPYSEHSSLFELTCFVLSLDWELRSTGNGSSRRGTSETPRAARISPHDGRHSARSARAPGVVPYRTLEFGKTEII